MASIENEIAETEMTLTEAVNILGKAAKAVDFIHSQGSDNYEEYIAFQPTPKALAEFLLVAVPWGNSNTLEPNKELAVAVAEAFGPDFAELLVQFADFVHNNA